jgi:hypothetical protein
LYVRHRATSRALIVSSLSVVVMLFSKGVMHNN